MQRILSRISQLSVDTRQRVAGVFDLLVGKRLASQSCRSRYFQHAINTLSALFDNPFREYDFRQLMLHTQIEFFHRIELHVRAFVTGAVIFRRRGDEGFVRTRLLHLMQDTRLCGYDTLTDRWCCLCNRPWPEYVPRIPGAR